MKIGMILDNYFPPDPRVSNEAKSLIEQGHEVHLFSLQFNDESPAYEEIDGIKVSRYLASRLTYKLSALAYDLPFYHWLLKRRLRNFVERTGIEVLHIHDMVIARAVFWVNRSYKLPVVIDFHENRPEIMRSYLHVLGFPGRYLISLKRWKGWYFKLAAKADKVVVVTKAAAEDIAKKTQIEIDGIVVVPNTSKISDYAVSPSDKCISEKMEGTFNVLYFGDTSLRRGTDTAIMAANYLRDRIPSLRLWIIGKSSADPTLRSMITELKLESFVALEGWQPMDRLPAYLENTHVAISPLKRNRHHDTTYANKIFQYMTCKKALVVSDAKSQAELVKRTGCGLVHEADAPSDLAEKIFYLYSNSNERVKMGELGYQAVVNHWNWNCTVETLLKLYSSIESDLMAESGKKL